MVHYNAIDDLMDEKGNVDYESLSEKYHDAMEKLESAYDKLQEENKRLRSALEQYANPQNWRYWQNGSVGAHDAWLDFKPGHYSKTHTDLGIWIAKQALSGSKVVK